MSLWGLFMKSVYSTAAFCITSNIPHPLSFQSSCIEGQLNVMIESCAKLNTMASKQSTRATSRSYLTRAIGIFQSFFQTQGNPLSLQNDNRVTSGF